MARILFITGTDTGVGKTELAVLLGRFLRSRGVRFSAVKPFCSGGRADARRLWRAQGGGVPIDSINPWHFKAPVAPLIAARMERRRCSARQVLSWLRAAAAAVDVLVVEGAGGLLSPLSVGLDARRLIVELRATPVIVCPDRLGAINQIRLALEALPAGRRRHARVVLVEQARSDESTDINRSVLAQWLGRGRILRLPRLMVAERRPGDWAGLPKRCLPVLRALAG